MQNVTHKRQEAHTFMAAKLVVIILTSINQTFHLSIQILCWLNPTTENFVPQDSKEQHYFTQITLENHLPHIFGTILGGVKVEFSKHLKNFKHQSNSQETVRLQHQQNYNSLLIISIWSVVVNESNQKMQSVLPWLI